MPKAKGNNGGAEHNKKVVSPLLITRSDAAAQLQVVNCLFSCSPTLNASKSTPSQWD